MNTILFVTVLALAASPIYAQEVQNEKKVDKRGIVGLGYGGYYGLNGLTGLNGYAGHGYVNAVPAYPSYNSYPGYSSAYVTPASHGYGASIYAPPVRVGYAGYAGYNGFGIGNGLGYLHG